MASNQQEANLDASLKALREAASSLKSDESNDFVTYTTIVDVHLTNGLTKFTADDKKKLVEGFKGILSDFEELASNIAWDVISTLLPFVTEKPSTETSDDNKSNDNVVGAVKDLLTHLAKIGNPREVFLVISGKLSSMDFHAQRITLEGRTDQEIEAVKKDEEEGSEASFGLGEPLARMTPEQDYIADQAIVLLELLAIVQPRIRTKKLSKFLTTSLMSILAMFSRASQCFSSKKVAEILSSIDKYFDVVVALEKSEAEEDKEDVSVCSKLQDAFLTHLVEEFLSGSAEDARTARFASRYYKALRPEKIVPLPQGGEGGVFGDPKQQQQQQPPDLPAQQQEDLDAIVFSMTLLVDLSEKLKVSANNLFGACMIPDKSAADASLPPGSPAVPEFASDISLSSRGSLLLLAGKIMRATDDSSLLKDTKIFPHHAQLSALHLQEDPPSSIIDALLFLGSWILHRNSVSQTSKATPFDNLTKDNEKFLLYIQKYAAISATSPDPAIRFLAHSHVAAVLNRNPKEEVKLTYIRDTLEHCPFEALKAAVIGILKDEVIAALNKADSAENSIFLSPVLLESLHDFLFPDYSDYFPGRDFQTEWPKFMELYSTITATANFYYLILANETLRQKLGIFEGGAADEAEQRWATVIKGINSTFSKNLEGGVEGLEKEDVAHAKLELDMMIYTLERLDAERQRIGE